VAKVRTGNGVHISRCVGRVFWWSTSLVGLRLWVEHSGGMYEIVIASASFLREESAFPLDGQKQIPRFARDDNSNSFVTTFCKIQQVLS
jgi:hypothetical protein